MSKSSELELSSGVVEVLGELTQDEERELHRLEIRVERAFCEAGAALRELRDKRLYRSTHKTFEEYCRDRFGFTRHSANLKILAVDVVDDLVTNGHQILPTNERQIRPITNLQSQERSSVWQQAVEEAGNKAPSGRIVKGIVERLKEKPLFKANDFCAIGDVFTLTRLEGAERKYNGCWAIASDVKDFTVVVDAHDTTLIVKPENLNSIDEPDIRRQLPQILKRIRRLRDCGLLDRCAYTVLESLGKQTYLTDLEEKMLSYLEEYYRVNSEEF